MTCKCKERAERDRPMIHGPYEDSEAATRPDESCLYCAEKHLATAAVLARELGYAAPNRGYVVGELAAACWHLYRHSPEARALSDELRELRHRIQTRQEDETARDFGPYLETIDRLIRAEQEKDKAKEETP